MKRLTEWEYRARDCLRMYNGMKIALINIPAQIEKLNGDFVSPKSARTDAEPVAGGTNRREDALIKNIVDRDNLKRRLKDTEIDINCIKRSLETLDAQERLILERMYMNVPRWSLERMSREMGYEKSTIYELRDRALKKFTVAMFGVEHEA